MPDPLRILAAMGAAALAAAVVLLACGRLRPGSGVGWPLALAAGWYAGCRTLGLWPKWPPVEDQDRLLFVLLPLVVGIEAWASLAQPRFWLAWAPRILLALGAAPLLLYGTSYISNVAGPGSRQWSPGHALAVLAGLGAALTLVWMALARLTMNRPETTQPARHGFGSALSIALAVTCFGTALAIMLSGYATGGQLGLPLAAAAGGAALAALALRQPTAMSGGLGVIVVGLFSLLVMGRLFGELSTPWAALLFCAPLVAWLGELPPLVRYSPLFRGLLQVGLVTAVVGVAVVGASRRFAAAPTDAAPAGSGGIEDYLHFSK